MKVEVKLYGILRDYRPPVEGLPHHPFTVDLPEHAAVEELLQHLSLSDDLVAGLAVNNAHANLQTTLRVGDKISFFPPTAGGAPNPELQKLLIGQAASWWLKIHY